MFWLRKIFSFLMSHLVSQYFVGKAQRKATLLYLKALQAMRRSLMIALFVFFILQLMVLGFLGMVITGIWLAPTPDLQTKLYLLLGFFGILFVVPFIGLMIFFSERTWYRVSGAQKMMEENSPP